MSTDVMLREVRLSFPVFGEAEAFPGTTKKRFSAAHLVVPGSDNDKVIQAAILAEAQAAWPKTWQAMLESFRGNSQKYCYVKGDIKEYEGYAGMLVLSGHRYEENGPPLLLGPDIDDRTGKLRVLTGKEGKLYAGCYVNAKVQIYAQTKTYPGIRCGLITEQFARDGDAFSSGAKPTDDGFGSLAEDANAPASVGASSLV